MSATLINRALRVGEGRKMKARLRAVEEISAREEEIQDLSDAALCERADMIRTRLVAGTSTIEQELVECFALVREAAWRTLGLRPFDVQLVGAGVLLDGNIAEMKTGEGKTLAAVPAVVLRALEGKGVHVVTVNDYLAERDARWMGPVYEMMGVSVGVIVPGLDTEARRAAYACDVTYGTNSEFGFDYLRDNMATAAADRVQRGHHFCVVDEVDSILIDEARTPLIISGAPEQAADTYYRFARIIPTLRAGEDYEKDEKHKTVAPTESGVAKVERALGIDHLYRDTQAGLVNHLVQALRAEALYHRDKQYIVRDGEVLIVDEFTGRVLEGRRYSEGLHQAIEAKEGLRIQEENQTLATITLQNYFRMYDTLSGMTGTAATEANEFNKIYKVEVVEIPTHRPVTRRDENDLIFATKEGKWSALVEEVVRAHKTGQPVLIGTASVAVSEELSGRLKRRGIPHSTLNAKQHEKEAEIIAGAGEQGAVTIATNMAGRGVDIKLGDGVAELGGLYVIGTERHESRRIDNQLRGRSGRQGDPGLTRFYLSGEDDLVRIFSGDRMQNILQRFGGGDDVPLDSKLITRTVENAQKKVEELNFTARKKVLEYDDVLNKQRTVIYRERNEVLDGEDFSETARDWIAQALVGIVERNPGELEGEFDLDGIIAEIKTLYPTALTADELEGATEEEILDQLEDEAMARYDAKEADLGAELMREVERWAILTQVDGHWREHLLNMDYLRQGIHLRGLAQKDPLVEYQREGHEMFDELMASVQVETVRTLFQVEIEAVPEARPQAEITGYSAQDDPVLGVAAALESDREIDAPTPVERPAAPPEPARSEKVGRNQPCPCGSGKKYKHCHGAA